MSNQDFSIGSILYSSWGYEQTNINFFQVISLIGKSTLELRELNQIKTFQGNNDFCERTVPAMGCFKGSLFKARVRKSGFITVRWGLVAGLWSGLPL